MKNKYVFVLALTLSLAGCTKNFEDFNTDQKRPETVTGEMLFSSAQKSLADQLSSPNVNENIFELWAQYWTETTYTDEANYDIINRTIADYTFQVYYLDVLRDLKEATTLISAEAVTEVNTQADVNNKLSIIELLVVFSYQNLVDIFGNIPYTKALDINNLLPAYDDAKSIYTDLISRTNAALSTLAATGNAGFGPADLIYGGDVEAWIKFGNSLKIKLGISIADADAGLAQSTIESAAAGAFTSHGDDAIFAYQGSVPNANKMYEEIVKSGRKDFVAANTLVDIMNGLDDPRLEFYFTQVDTSTEQGVEKLAYLGGAYGETSPYTQYSHIDEAILKPTFPGLILTYDQVLFYLAEAAQRGFSVGAAASDLYNDAIQASFDFWDAGDASAYIAQTDVAYDAGAWKEKIATQSWIAFYLRGLEGYTQWRRLDAPAMNIAPTITDASEIPVRFTYPINEQTLNAANYKQASEAIGGDELTTKIFWDKN